MTEIKSKSSTHYHSRGISLCYLALLPPANELWEGYVSTGVCLSTGGLCPGGLCPEGGLSPGGSLSRGGSVQGGLCPGVSVQGVCPGGVSVRETPSWTEYGNKRAVRILLECILVIERMYAQNVWSLRTFSHQTKAGTKAKIFFFKKQAKKTKE